MVHLTENYLCKQVYLKTFPISKYNKTGAIRNVTSLILLMYWYDTLQMMQELLVKFCVKMWLKPIFNW